MEKIKLNVLGFSFSQAENGTFGLVLAEEYGNRRLMVVIGTPEAQSIAFMLQGSTPPRPLTHDLLYHILSDFDIQLQEVLIYKHESNVFFSRLFLTQYGKQIIIEARTSDAVALALRSNSPIYVYSHIMNELGIDFKQSSDEDLPDSPSHHDISQNSAEELQRQLKQAIEQENYERASLLRDKISALNNPNNTNP